MPGKLKKNSITLWRLLDLIGAESAEMQDDTTVLVRFQVLEPVPHSENIIARRVDVTLTDEVSQRENLLGLLEGWARIQKDHER